MKISAKGQGANLLKMAKQTSSVIGQKDKSQKGGFKRAKHAKYSKKRTFITPGHAHVSGKKYSIFGKFGVLCFLETSVLRFALFASLRKTLKILR